MSVIEKKRRGGRPRTGHLEFRGKTWWAQLTIDVDGAKGVRTWVNMHTASKPAARVKMKQAIAENAAGRALTTGDLAERAKQAETFKSAAERCRDARVAAGVKSAKEEFDRLTKYAFDDIGELGVDKIDTTLVNGVLDAAVAAGKAKQTCQHVKQNIANVFAMLKREGAIKVNPCTEAELPKFPKRTKKVRAKLNDAELVTLIGWTHPEKRYQKETLEVQVMSVVSRCFGGVRTGDEHAMGWESFDTENGDFEWGWAPREKTGEPQLLAIPEVMRPVLRLLWQLATSEEFPNGKPTHGPVFPLLRGERAGEQRGKGSHARALRRTLMRAFGIEETREVQVMRKGGRKLTKRVWVKAREMTKRERELFEEGPYSLRLDFHSWRRSYALALADANVNAQQAQALIGHASLTAHARYLADRSKMRSLPEAALPRIGVFHQVSGETSANDPPSSNENGLVDADSEPRPTDDHRLRHPVALGFSTGSVSSTSSSTADTSRER